MMDGSRQIAVVTQLMLVVLVMVGQLSLEDDVLLLVLVRAGQHIGRVSMISPVAAFKTSMVCTKMLLVH